MGPPGEFLLHLSIHLLLPFCDSWVHQRAMGYALLGQPVIYSNHCPSASMGWLVIGEEMAHWLASAWQKNVTAYVKHGGQIIVRCNKKETNLEANFK